VIVELIVTALGLKDFSWERMIAAVEDVRECAVRATAAGEQARTPADHVEPLGYDSLH
jgi:hypothetical protein